MYGAKYFTSGRFKALLADHGCFLSIVSPANSNGSRVERDIKSIRSFLHRYPDSYNSWDTIYMLSLWLNIFTNRVTLDGVTISPYELHYRVKPYSKRYLKAEIPHQNYRPEFSNIDTSTWIKTHNDSISKSKKKPPVSIGQHVTYKKYGSKDPTLLPATVISVSDDTCNIKIKSGLILTRLYKDIVF